MLKSLITSIVFALGIAIAFGIAKLVTGDWATLLIFLCGIATCFAIIFLRIR